MNYLKLTTLEKASEALKENGNAKIIAGGTDLLVHYRHRKVVPDVVVDVKDIDILSGVKVEDGYLKIGATTILNHLAENSVIKNDFNVIRQAAQEIGCYQVRNRATIGGNICNASPAGDTIPPLYCLKASLTYFYNGEMIDCKVEEFFKGPGKTVLEKGAILCQIKVPMELAGKPGVFMRHSRRRSLDLSTVSVTVVNNDGKYSMALGSVAPTVIRVPKAEEILNAKGLTEESIKLAAEAANESCTPISDLRGSKEYRSEMVKSYTVKALKSLMEG